MKLSFVILFSLCNSLIIRAQDSVYYAKITNTRTYMNIDRVSATEYWFTKDKSCVLTNRTKSIIRQDLGVVYVINLLTGSVRSESIKPSISVLPAVMPIDKRYIGHYYIPVYEWNEPKQLPSVTIGEYVCEHLLCEGDADFDQISLEYMVTKTDNQFMAARLNSTIMSLGGSGNKQEPIARLITGNKNLIILRIIETVENPIAPHVTTTINVDKLELLKSSDGLFDLTDNPKKSY
jgi:hypothetical protein